MARKQQPLVGTRRTREHLIGDLAVNHVERQVLLGNGTVARIAMDYGIDLILFTHTATGEIESGNIYLQVKGTERIAWNAEGTRASFRVERTHLVGWLRQVLPVILILYDVAADRAHWVHVQGYFRDVPGFNLFAAGQRVTVHLDASRMLVPEAIRQFAAIRDRVEES